MNSIVKCPSFVIVFQVPVIVEKVVEVEKIVEVWMSC